jgi:NAD+ dependent glucose-6-phosphate dehydrogenase
LLPTPRLAAHERQFVGLVEKQVVDKRCVGFPPVQVRQPRMRQNMRWHINAIESGASTMERKLRVGITGAGGNLGSTLFRGLQSKFDLELLDIRKPSSISDHPFKIIDLAVPEQMSEAFVGLDALIHLAGNPSPAARKADTMRNNFLATSLTFEQAKKDGVKKIVFASSNFYHQRDITAALRSGGKIRIGLDSVATPDCTYGESKVFGENLGFHYACLGMRFVALRIGWSVPEDSPVPYDSPYMRAMFCSKRDLVHCFERALLTDAKFLTGFAISDNDAKVFDLAQTQIALDFTPSDNSANYT